MVILAFLINLNLLTEHTYFFAFSKKIICVNSEHSAIIDCNKK